jgi:hypothetical protein
MVIAMLFSGDTDKVIEIILSGDRDTDHSDALQ